MPEWITILLAYLTLAIVLGTIGAVYERHLKFKEKQLDILTRETAEKAARYAAQTERLEQRMRTLERIITDRRGDLAREIEDLRDAPLN
ncbi:hypothetical protein [Blastomonas sp.]|uniref:hypothetical protein n=1 Tax=Blastomonas sp. TaxID=1909299 RepID=UPI00359461EC